MHLIFLKTLWSFIKSSFFCLLEQSFNKKVLMNFKSNRVWKGSLKNWQLILEGMKNNNFDQMIYAAWKYWIKNCNYFFVGFQTRNPLLLLPRLNQLETSRLKLFKCSHIMKIVSWRFQFQFLSRKNLSHRTNCTRGKWKWSGIFISIYFYF